MILPKDFIKSLFRADNIYANGYAQKQWYFNIFIPENEYQWDDRGLDTKNTVNFPDNWFLKLKTYARNPNLFLTCSSADVSSYDKTSEGALILSKQGFKALEQEIESFFLKISATNKFLKSFDEVSRFFNKSNSSRVRGIKQRLKGKIRGYNDYKKQMENCQEDIKILENDK